MIRFAAEDDRQAPDRSLAAAVVADLMLGPSHRIGIDLVDIAMLERQVESSIGGAFVERLFSPVEISDSRGQVQRLATRWAVKESVAKAIGTGFRNGLRPIDILVTTAPNGQIAVRPFGDTVWPHSASEWEWRVSASHEGGWAVAIALAVVGDRIGDTEEYTHE
jgi:holo-[acyl-carrier protein] synthase